MSKGTEHNSSSEDLKKTNVTSGWVPQGEYVEVAGRIIPGMVYICNSNEVNVSEDDHTGSTSCIDLAKPVSGSDKLGNLLTTRKYADMAPECRASYLDWLANGKKDRNLCPEYVMTYFYGLERRMLLDFPKNEEEQLWNEFERLETVFKFNDELMFSIDRMYSYIVLVSHPMDSDLEFPNEFVPYPFELHLEINYLLRAGKALTGDLLFHWFSFDCNADVRNALTAPGLREGFMKRFNELHPEGLKLDCPKKGFEVEYASQTGDFRLSKEVKVDGVPLLDIRKFKPAMNEAKSILDGLNRNWSKPNTGQSESASPSHNVEFRSGLKNDNIETPHVTRIDAGKFIKWAQAHVGKNSPVQFGELLDNLGFEMRTDAGELDRVSISFLLSNIGFGIAPHWILYFPYLTRTDNVFLYETETDHQQREGRETFEKAIIGMGIGACLYSHGKCSSSEVGTALQRAAAFWKELNEGDIPGIHANIHYLQATLPDEGFFSRLLEVHPEDMMKEIRSVSILMAYVFKSLTSKKVAMMEALYESLNLNPELAKVDLLAGEPTSE